MGREFDKFKKGEKIDELRDVLKGKKEARPSSLPSDEGETDEAPQGPTPPGPAPMGLPEADSELLDKEIHVLQGQIKEAEDQLKEGKDKYLRLLAEFENFRKRMEREKDEVGRFANEKILQEIFPVVDHLEMTLSHAAQASDDKNVSGKEEKGAVDKTSAILEGVGLVLKQLEKSLEKFGLKKVGVEGEIFDPHRHEAIGQVESGDHKPGTVVLVHRGGFTLHDRLIRPALVTVACEPKETLH